ncbi:MAG: phytoene/squalene synthase family protein [Planctomycetota bacterium]
MTTARADAGTVIAESDRLACDRLQDAYASCAEIVRARARNFYYGLRLTPEPKRSAIYAVYAWMREADDIADDPGLSQADRDERFGAFEALTERLLDGGNAPADAGPCWTAMRDAIDRYAIDPEDLRKLIRGVRADIEAGDRVEFAARADLETYCDRVASTAGRICVAIWGIRDDTQRARARELATVRGHAFQITNVLRDLGEDLDEGRCYLPSDLLERHGVTCADLRSWAKPAACESALREAAGWAARAYQESAELDEMIVPECRAAIGAMTDIYNGLLRVIERDPSRVVSDRRVRLAGWRKVAIAVRAAVTGRAAQAS